MYTDNEYDVAKRSHMWDLKRQEKLKKVSEEFNKRLLEPCTFYPGTESI